METLYISFWQWWVLAGVLLSLELFMPGTFLLWIGIAAGFTGLVVWGFQDITPSFQLVLFALSSLVSVVIWSRYFKRVSNPLAPDVSDRSSQYIGRTVVLENPIKNGVGQINLDDTFWTIHGPNLKAGTRVTIIRARQGILEVREME